MLSAGFCPHVSRRLPPAGHSITSQELQPLRGRSRVCSRDDRKQRRARGWHRVPCPGSGCPHGGCCSKVRTQPGHVLGPRRRRTPQVRRNPQVQPCLCTPSWQPAPAGPTAGHGRVDLHGERVQVSDHEGKGDRWLYRSLTETGPSPSSM